MGWHYSMIWRLDLTNATYFPGKERFFSSSYNTWNSGEWADYQLSQNCSENRWYENNQLCFVWARGEGYKDQYCKKSNIEIISRNQFAGVTTMASSTVTLFRIILSFSSNSLDFCWASCTTKAGAFSTNYKIKKYTHHQINSAYW